MDLDLLEIDISKANALALDALAKNMWADYAAGRLADVAAERITKAIERRREILRTHTRNRRTYPLIDRLKRSTTANRSERIQHRRRVAQCGALPGHIAARFTVAQIATLSIVSAEIKTKGRCELYVGQIAAMAGCCGRMTQSAIAEAERLGLIKVERRRRPGRSNLANIITAIDTTLIAWLKRGNANKQLYWVKKYAGNNTRELKQDRIIDKQHTTDRQMVNRREFRYGTTDKIGQAIRT